MRAGTEEARSTNVEGSRNVAAVAGRGRPVVLASTSSCYGAIADGVCTEETPLRPVSLYGVTKAESEAVLLQESTAVVFRLATAYGLSPRLRLDLLVNDFVYRALHEHRLTVYEGRFRRSFIHVRDVARAVLLALDNSAAMAGQVFNVGDESQNLSKLNVCRIIQEVVPGVEIDACASGHDADRRDYTVHYARIRALGFRATVSLEEGVRACRGLALDVILGTRTVHFRAGACRPGSSGPTRPGSELSLLRYLSESHYNGDMDETPRVRRRWLWYGLPVLLGVVALVAIAGTWFAVKLKQAEKQRAAVETIRRLGGTVRYDYQRNPETARMVPPPGPGCLRERYGIDFVATVEAVDFGPRTPTEGGPVDPGPLDDAGLKEVVEHLEGVPRVSSLGISGRKVTDAGLKSIATLGQLKGLYIYATSITDSGLEEIRGLHELERLSISETGITDAGLRHLGGLRRLKLLYLNYTHVTQQGVNVLQGVLPDCKIMTPRFSVGPRAAP